MIITLIVFFILFFLDQLTKYLSVETLTDTPKVLINNFLSVRLEYNPGAAWSMGSDSTWVLVLISTIASIFLFWVCSKNDWKRAKFQAISITMAAAGCVANLFDRIITMIPSCNRDGVVDMIVFKPFDWICELFNLGTTVFNVADAFLVVGLILYAIDYLFFAERRKDKYGTIKN